MKRYVGGNYWKLFIFLVNDINWEGRIRCCLFTVFHHGTYLFFLVNGLSIIPCNYYAIHCLDNSLTKKSWVVEERCSLFNFQNTQPTKINNLKKIYLFYVVLRWFLVFYFKTYICCWIYFFHDVFYNCCYYFVLLKVLDKIENDFINKK